ncbi:MAG: hypothetical protein WAR02_19590, partial [Pseudolabrys sp.]
FNLFARFSDTRAKYLDQSYCNFGVISNQWNEIAALNNHQLAVLYWNGICRPLPSIKEGDFSKKFARHDQVEYRVLSFFGRGADPHRACANGVKLRADIPFSKYNGAFCHFGRYDTRRQAINDSITQIFEKRMGAKQHMLVEGLRRCSHSHATVNQNKFQQNVSYDKIERHSSILRVRAEKIAPKTPYPARLGPACARITGRPTRGRDRKVPGTM